MQIAWASILAAGAIAFAFSRRFFGLVHLQFVLRIQGLRTAPCGFVGKSIPVGHFVKERIRSRRVIRNEIGGFRNLWNIFTDVFAHLLAGIENPGLASDERFG